ncbi:MAG: SGNH/GDSL hydrolase family protein [Brevundimonas sp.]
MAIDEAAVNSAIYRRNLFNAATAQDGKRVRLSDGTLETVAAYFASDFIAVEAGQAYTLTTGQFIGLYDAAQAFVASDNPNLFPYTLTIPAGVAFMRASGQKAIVTADVFMVQKGTSLTTDYIPWTRVIDASKTMPNTLPGDGLQDQSIAPAKARFLKLGKNLFDKDAAAAGFLVNSTTGQLQASAGWTASDFIPVTPGESYTLSRGNYLAFFSAGRAILGTGSNPNANAYTVTAPAGAAFLRCSIQPGQIPVDFFQVEKGASATAYEAFNYSLTPSLVSGQRMNRVATPAGNPRLWMRGAQHLRNTRRTLRARQMGLACQFVWAGFGDSYTDGVSYWSQPVTIDELPRWTAGRHGSTGVGYGGPGWIGFGASINGVKGYVAPYLYGASRSGTWTDQFATQIHSPDTCSATSSTAGDKYTVTSVSGANPVCTTAKLAYVAGSGGVRYRWNAGAWTSLDLSTGTGLAFASLTGVPATAAWTLEIEVETGSCVLCGLLPASDASGLVFHKVAATGSRIADLAAANATSMALALTTLNPDLVTLGTPINDRGSGYVASRTPAQFKADVLTHVQRVRAAAPRADILLFCPAEIVGSFATPMSAYADVMDELSIEQGVAFMDWQPVFGAAPADYNFASAISLLGTDGVHLNIADPHRWGARIATDLFMRALTTF